ncbi:alkaline phosphatase family protein [Robertkochia flava]|uniref:alkaline phosphatase family protein n=1 Tax=Robertkochia flava TaxID=3447986 RepID=UPI001CD0035E|nr:nucleotide pyrophosphatase/phosphodiesterase family protein [Robertkochia marina]
MRKTVVINIVGLSPSLLGENTPFLNDFLSRGSMTRIRPAFPAVTCTAQSAYLTGKLPAQHGIVGNGWYFKEELEIKFWRQSNRLVQSAKIWETLKERDAEFTCANLFWWYNMYSSADYSVTPRPNYLADGRKIPDVYSHPADLRNHLQQKLGRFPLFKFWGPATDITSSKWIANAAVEVDKKYDPTLTLVYLPHLDYNLQRWGTDPGKVGKDLQEIDRLVRDLVGWYEKKNAQVVLLSEYGITDVRHPVHLNRTLREMGLLAVREERGRELLDAGASQAFAVADHQVAHIYVKDQGSVETLARKLGALDGVDKIWYGEQRREVGLKHDRAGDIVVSADKDSWITYYYWFDDAKAPDFAPTVDIHRKPGYDPVEMFTDPDKSLMPLRILWKLLKRKLGFRVLMDVIPLKPELVKGSHGRVPEDKNFYPLAMSNSGIFEDTEEIAAEEIYDIILNLVTKSKNYENVCT